MQIDEAVVTGGTGFLGRVVVRKLVAAGIHCWVPTRIRKSNPPGTSYLRCDLLRPADCRKLATKAADAEVLVHCAANMPHSSADRQALLQEAEENVRQACNLLRANFCKLRLLVLASSVDVYGQPRSLPVTEDHPTVPQTFYAASKLAVENLCRVWSAETRIPLTILRFAQVYGPQEPSIKAIPRFLEKVLRGEAITICGNGSDTRDYVFVEDVAEAILLAVTKRKAGIFNIAGGTPAPVLRAAEILFSLHGSSPHVRYQPRERPAIHQAFSIRRARRILGYRPRFDLSAGLARTYLQHPMVSLHGSRRSKKHSHLPQEN